MNVAYRNGKNATIVDNFLNLCIILYFLLSTEPDIDFLPELTTQGTLWFADMCQSDLLIPIMLGVVNLALVEVNSSGQKKYLFGKKNRFPSNTLIC